MFVSISQPHLLPLTFVVTALLNFSIRSTYAATLVPTDPASISLAIGGIARTASGYYTPSSDGAIPQNGASDASGIQWYESGIYFGAMMDYGKVTNDGQYMAKTVGALYNASYGPLQSFLGPYARISETLLGRWNDDIMWWALGPLTGAEVFGVTATMGKYKYIDLVVNTYTQVWEQWDPTTCGGGIYWSRDRTAKNNQGTYKSVITNVQFILAAARLAVLTGNTTYTTQAAQVYTWMKTIGLITPTFHLYDGANAPTCSPLNAMELSYSLGILMGGLGMMFKATGDAVYQTDAAQFLDVGLGLYAPASSGGVLADPCETTSAGCKPNEVSPKGTFLRGLGYLYRGVSDPAIKTKIQTLVEVSAASMVTHSCDASWNCGNVWTASGGKPSTDFHSQLNSLELMIALAVVHTPASIAGGSVLSESVATTGVSSVSGDQSHGNTATTTKNAGVGSGLEFADRVFLLGSVGISMMVVGVVSRVHWW
ncbi:hypothetical protein BASA50_001342 [Batrachochytrium salamandrivorans]|uniref:Mannan endo-1,6-alpha-mannosidase n=1 Tax=Batrachochytrium salamandrivorans TaxID=1357716 RepID=A0ABQ8EY85_9FUNG|nr:hypothetical protein BASA50_001342 [Batrachochytrium salamandrivorans]KAH9244397.1 hypothetical protein BASA81_018213 [Batrachochytrium salamandrivorans]